jgi:hypothetical protein
METVAQNIWRLPSPMRLLGVAMQRSSAIIRHGDCLSLISPTDDMDFQAVASLGKVVHIVAPTYFHDTGMKTAAMHFPEASLWGVAGLEKALPDLEIRPLNIRSMPEDWAYHFKCFLIEGMPKVNEHVIWHEASGTLITSDLIFNIGPKVDAWTKLFFRLNGTWQRPGPTRIFKSLVKQKAAFHDSIQRLKMLPIKKILPAHGGLIDDPEVIRKSLQRLRES